MTVCCSAATPAPLGDPPRWRFVGGGTNPGVDRAFEVKAFVTNAESLKLRGGDFARPNTGGDPRTGDFARAKEEKGDEDDANASNPDRFKTMGVEAEGPKDRLFFFRCFGDVLLGAVVGGGDGLFDEKMFWPLTAANGELVDAYAMNPL